MESFLRETVSGDRFELLIDPKIFSKDIVLKASYNFLDVGFFFFKFDAERNIILQFTKKKGIKEDAKYIIGEFSDELLDVYLRDKLERENRVIRESIVHKALLGPVEAFNYVSHDPNNPIQVGGEEEKPEIDFDKDIDEIIKEIENDPDLQIDEQEIQQMLQEIEQETADTEISKPQITVDPESISQAKKLFQDKK